MNNSCIFGAVDQLFSAVDDVEELRLQRSASNQEAVDVGLRVQLIAVGCGRGTTVDDPGVISYAGRHLIFEPCSDLPVGLLSLLGGGSDASANSPNRLVRYNNFTPVLNAEAAAYGFQLLGTDLHGSAVLPVR